MIWHKSQILEIREGSITQRQKGVRIRKKNACRGLGLRFCCSASLLARQLVWFIAGQLGQKGLTLSRRELPGSWRGKGAYHSSRHSSPALQALPRPGTQSFSNRPYGNNASFFSPYHNLKQPEPCFPVTTSYCGLREHHTHATTLPGQLVFIFLF